MFSLGCLRMFSSGCFRDVSGYFRDVSECFGTVLGKF